VSGTCDAAGDCSGSFAVSRPRSARLSQSLPLRRLAIPALALAIQALAWSAFQLRKHAVQIALRHPCEMQIENAAIFLCERLDLRNRRSNFCAVFSSDDRTSGRFGMPKKKQKACQLDHW
jgi:hypothetical protein